MPAPTPQSEALPQAREHGLWGRADSPPDWQQALDGAIAGDPILVKDPTDPRDDFFLVPMRPGDPTAHRSAWIMLDPVTLKLREAALLDHWKFPAFPNGSDARLIAQSALHLPDGTQCKFTQAALKPNHKNLVWRAGDASILPYWPLKEWIAPHPITGEPVSIYVTQEGEVLTTLSAETPSAPAAPKKSSPLRLGLTLVAGVLIGVGVNAWWQNQHPVSTPTAIIISNEDEVKTLTNRLAEATADTTRKEHEIQLLQEKIAEMDTARIQLERTWSKKIADLTNQLAEAVADTTRKEHEIQILQKQITELGTARIQLERTWSKKFADLTNRLADATADTTRKEHEIQILQKQINELDTVRIQIEMTWSKKFEDLTNRLADAEAAAKQRERQIQIFQKMLEGLGTRKAPAAEDPPSNTPEKKPRPSPVIPLTENPGDRRKP